jgi:predicted alpha/beta superfamily hydrolase
MKKLFVLILIFTAVGASVQYPVVNIPGSEVRKITSTIVAGQEYELQILLPGGYKNSNKKYPVVYLMDSQWDFPLVKSIYGQQYYDGFIPEMIIVGVTWGGINPNPDSLRARDYTPTNDGRLKQSGGADKFLSFIKDELFPFVESNYKADNTNRILMGCSLGGLFAIYTILTHTEMFQGYAAASPAVGWDKEVLYQYEKKFAVKKIADPVRLYLTVGDAERGRPVFEKFATRLSSQNYTNLNVRSKVLENTGHSGTKSETYSRGLQYIFERPKLTLTPGMLDKYTGSFSSATGTKLEIKNENSNLVLYFSQTNKYILYAATETTFYSSAEFLNISFTIQDGKAEEVKLERYGRTDLLKKEN